MYKPLREVGANTSIPCRTVAYSTSQLHADGLVHYIAPTVVVYGTGGADLRDPVLSTHTRMVMETVQGFRGFAPTSQSGANVAWGRPLCTVFLL